MAAEISLVRIDDRLIHGQVVTAWLKYYPSDVIIIVDEGVAKDSLMQRVLRAAAPKGSTVVAKSVGDTIAYINGGEHDREKVMLIAKGPEPIEELVCGGVAIKAVVLGGMGIRAGRTKLNRNVSASEEEVNCMKRLVEKGIEVGYHLVPQESYIPLDKLL
ncbi:MAG TPA: PTS sugar transporter subunit IIB [Atopobiaceae bacterium]|nr:PTS sugar transporter subunit IIB [Atopobiaceae bacterium]